MQTKYPHLFQSQDTSFSLTFEEENSFTSGYCNDTYGHLRIFVFFTLLLLCQSYLQIYKVRLEQNDDNIKLKDLNYIEFRSYTVVEKQRTNT